MRAYYSNSLYRYIGCMLFYAALLRTPRSNSPVFRQSLEMAQEELYFRQAPDSRDRATRCCPACYVRVSSQLAATDQYLVHNTTVKMRSVIINRLRLVRVRRRCYRLLRGSVKKIGIGWLFTSTLSSGIAGFHDTRYHDVATIVPALGPPRRIQQHYEALLIHNVNTHPSTTMPSH